MILWRIHSRFRYLYQCAHIGCKREACWLQKVKQVAYCDNHKPLRKKRAKLEVTDTSYTVKMACPNHTTNLHVVAETEVQARLVVADDLARGIWFGHPVLPTVIACDENSLTGIK